MSKKRERRTNKHKPSAIAAHRKRTRTVSLRTLPKRSQMALDRSLRIPSLMSKRGFTLTRAAKFVGVKTETAKKYLENKVEKKNGKFRVRKIGRLSVTLYLPDADGNPVPLKTTSPKQRRRASQYLRDLGRYLRGKRDALTAWHGRSIAGLELVTDGRTIKAIEPALSEFSLYRSFNGGAE